MTNANHNIKMKRKKSCQHHFPLIHPYLLAPEPACISIWFCCGCIMSLHRVTQGQINHINTLLKLFSVNVSFYKLLKWFKIMQQHFSILLAQYVPGEITIAFCNTKTPYSNVLYGENDFNFLSCLFGFCSRGLRSCRMYCSQQWRQTGYCER